MKNRVYKICKVRTVRGKKVYVSSYAEGVWERTYKIGKETRGYNDGLLFCVPTLKLLTRWSFPSCVIFACDAIGVINDYKKHGFFIRSSPFRQCWWRRFWKLYRKGFEEALTKDPEVVERSHNSGTVFAEAVTPVKMITLSGREVKQ